MTSDTDTATLHMVQLHLKPKRLVGLAKMLGLPLAQVDNNYMVHCALGELFQEQAPTPYCVEDDHRTMASYSNGQGSDVRVLGYADVDRETLEQLARGFASPPVYEIVDWERSASKPMPGYFPEGIRLGFELRACPVVRKASAGSGQTPEGKERSWRKGQELDAFLAEVWTRPEEELDRESVYLEWLERQLEIRGGAELKSFGMERFAIERMVRRTHGAKRKVRTLKRPDATFRGELVVTDGAAFSKLLESGIGRHKSFGFGMLKVRRA